MHLNTITLKKERLKLFLSLSRLTRQTLKSNGTIYIIQKGNFRSFTRFLTTIFIHINVNYPQTTSDVLYTLSI